MPEGLCGGVKTHWRDFGQGPARALAIHCSLGHSGAWEGMANELDDLLSIRAFDLPGHGGSADWDGQRPYADLGAAMGRDMMVGDDPIHLIGHSFGATLALRLAVELPHKVASLTLIECVFFTIARTDRPDAMPDAQNARAPFQEALEAGEHEAAARMFHKTWGDGRLWEEMSTRQQERLTRQIPLIGAVQSSNNGDPVNMLASGALTRLPVPTLLIEGAESPPHIAIINDGLAARIPDTERVVIPEAAHMVPITHPIPVAAALRGFLGRVGD